MDRELARVLQLSKRSIGKHSPLYRWMVEHHDVLNQEFRRFGPQWAERAKALGEAGLVNRKGEPPSVRVAQRTWYQVCKDIEANPSLKRATQPVPAVQPAPSLPPPSQPPPVVTISDEPEEDDFKLTFAGGPKTFTKKDSNDV